MKHIKEYQIRRFPKEQIKGVYWILKAAGIIRPKEYLDFPDLIKELISNGETVKGYVYDGYWLDIGRPDDYERANEDFKKQR